MPFGLFAGVAAVSLGTAVSARWGDDHRSFVRIDTQWLGDVVGRLEASAELLDRLDVVFTNLAAERGDDLEAPVGATRVLIRRSRPVRAVQEAAVSPIRFGALIGKLAEAFPTVSEPRIRTMVTDLLRQGFLITGLSLSERRRHRNCRQRRATRPRFKVRRGREPDAPPLHV
jgi:hypothetical protein